MKEFDKFISALRSAKYVAIISHLNPDVDALASSFVLSNILKHKFSIKADIFADKIDMPEHYNSLFKGKSINKKPKKYSHVIMLDAPNSSRLGKFQPIFDNCKTKLVIDHHATNNFSGDVNVVKLISSSCEIIYNLAKTVGYPLTNEDYANLYAGIITDTNNFTVGNFDQKTFKIVAEISKHVDCRKIYAQFLLTNTLKSMQVLAESIKNIEIFENGQIIFSKITKNYAKQHDLEDKDYAGTINKLATIYGNKFVCFIYPKGETLYVSMRAKEGYDVSALAKQFNGGGHTGAAAFLSNMKIEEIKKIVLKAFSAQLK